MKVFLPMKFITKWGCAMYVNFHFVVKRQDCWELVIGVCTCRTSLSGD